MVGRKAIPYLAGSSAKRMASIEQPHAAVAVTRDAWHARPHAPAASVHRVDRCRRNLTFGLLDLTTRYNTYLDTPLQVKRHASLARPFRTKILTPIRIRFFIGDPHSILLVHSDARSRLKERRHRNRKRCALWP